MTFRMGTLEGPLGAARAACVASLLERAKPGHLVEIVPAAGIETLREALLARAVDVAVHAYEQIPAARVEGLVLAAIPFRGDSREALVGQVRGPLRALPPKTIVAVGSELRRAQLAASCPQLDVRLLRCSSEGLLATLEAGEADACIVSAAELKWLAFAGKSRTLGFEEMLPAPAQGALVLECRADDAGSRALAMAIDRSELRPGVTAERTFVAAAKSLRTYPAAAYAESFGTTLKLNGLLVAPGRIVRSKMAGPLETAAGLGQALANELAALSR